MNTSKPKHERLASLKKYAELLESRFSIPGTQFRFGLDPILNFIPGLGSYSGLILGLIFILMAHRQGVSGKVKIIMFRNILIDHILGSLPVAGYITDFFYKSNEKNMLLLEEHLLDEKHSGSGLYLIVIFILIVLGILILTFFAFVWMLKIFLDWIS